jgi:hypothetical protein
VISATGGGVEIAFRNAISVIVDWFVNCKATVKRSAHTASSQQQTARSILLQCSVVVPVNLNSVSVRDIHSSWRVEVVVSSTFRPLCHLGSPQMFRYGSGYELQANLGFEVFTAVVMKNSVLQYVAQFQFIINRRFGGTCRLHLQGRRIMRARKSVRPLLGPYTSKVTILERQYCVWPSIQRSVVQFLPDSVLS